MMNAYQKKLLNKLLDQYEKSKTHIGANKNKQRFTAEIAKLFKRYADESDYDTFSAINNALQELEIRGYISLTIRSGEMYDKAELNMEKLSEIYHALGRKPKMEIYHEAEKLLKEYMSYSELLERFCTEQLANIVANKTVKYVSSDGDCTELAYILKALKEIETLETETFYRDFSVRIYGDSKVFDGISEKLAKLICRFDESENAETVLANRNLLKNPGHVYFKGNAQIVFDSQALDLSGLSGNMALSSEMLKSISQINVKGRRVITIENLTTFHTFPAGDDFVIYLGGYHNTIRREFIRMIYSSNLNKEYLHFGDIDAGGFYILEHLRRKTGVDFHPYLMSVEILKRHSSYCKPLTENDRSRLSQLQGTAYAAVAAYMLEHNCKLEQEAIDVSVLQICL